VSNWLNIGGLLAHYIQKTIVKEAGSRTTEKFLEKKNFLHPTLTRHAKAPGINIFFITKN
jgi:hypothetical protein